MAKVKYYVVWKGHQPGIYNDWNTCKEQIDGYVDAKYKSFSSLAEAEAAYREGWQQHWGNNKKKQTVSTHPAAHHKIDYNSISVDVGTRGNPGPIEYRGVDTLTGETLFHVGPIENGTNNLGEFIAIVHALAYLKQLGSDKTIYSDSLTAQAWVRNKRVASNLVRDESTKRIWELVDRAEAWLQNNTYRNKILKWQTEEWGEIKADFGRK